MERQVGCFECVATEKAASCGKVAAALLQGMTLDRACDTELQGIFEV